MLKLLDLINNDNVILTAHITNNNDNLCGKRSNFQAVVSHLLLIDPVEKKLTKSGSKCSFDALVYAILLLERIHSTGADLCWCSTPEFRKLP